jgi:hypothetical protein
MVILVPPRRGEFLRPSTESGRPKMSEAIKRLGGDRGGEENRQ